MQSQIKNLSSLGVLLSWMPDCVGKEIIFDRGYAPTFVAGIYKSSIGPVLVLQFRVRKNSDFDVFEVRWKVDEGIVQYFQSNPTQHPYSIQDEERWRINLLSALHSGGSLVPCKINIRTCDALEPQLDSILQRIEHAS